MRINFLNLLEVKWLEKKSKKFSAHYYRLIGWYNFQFYFVKGLLLINLRAPRTN